MTQTRTKIKIAGRPTLTIKEKLKILAETAGMWKGKKGDAILHEHKKVRREWENSVKKNERYWKKK